MPLIAASILLLPLQRLLAPNWPESVVEWIDASGRVELRSESGIRHDDAVPRSRPLHAARVEFRRLPSAHGYVVGLRHEGLELEPPDGRWWRPDEDCELGLSDADRPEQVRWLDCASIRRVVWPNRLALIDRFVLAGRRVVDARLDPD